MRVVLREGLVTIRHRSLLLVISLSCHVLAFTVFIESGLATGAQLRQVQVLIVVTFVLSALFLILPFRPSVPYIQFLRAFCIAIITALLKGKALILEVLLLLPFILDTTRHPRWITGFFVTSAAFLFGVIVDFLQLRRAGLLVAFDHAGVLLLISISLLILAVKASRDWSLLQRNGRQIRDQNLAIENLEKANKAFQDYTERIRSLSSEQERNRITRELHDTIGYSLTNIIMLMNAGKVLGAEKIERLQDTLEQGKQQADSALCDCRRILYQLRAISTDEAVGLAAIHQLVKAFSKTTQIEVDFHYGNLRESYNQYTDLVIYRVIQEGLTNILRHANAKKITITLWESDSYISISVRDDGRGAEIVREGIGLKGMRERLAQLGGTLEAHADAYGFALTACIPLGNKDEAKDNGSDQNSNR